MGSVRLSPEQMLGYVQSPAIVSGAAEMPSGLLRIETALSYPDGSRVDLYLRQADDLFPEERLALTDGGETMAWLLHVPIKPWLSAKRQSFLDDILHTLRVRQDGAELVCDVRDAARLGEDIVRLGQACVRAADLIFTKRAALAAGFAEEVEEVVADCDLPYEVGPELLGRHGNPVRVDFLVTGVAQSTAVLALSAQGQSSARTSAHSAFCKWYDLAIPERQEQRVTVYDDRQEKVYRSDDLDRLADLSTLVPLFADPRALARLLVA
jgi:hypothetical protein